MKLCLLISLVLLSFSAFPQPRNTSQNIFIITIDGFRWQEVFKGADLDLIQNENFVKDTALIRQQFWCEDLIERRKKLMSFFWNVIAENGMLAGNREYGNEVNVSNLYKISYPGYNEILTGFADKKFIPNLTVWNKNTNILEYLNSCDNYSGKVAAFCSWNLMSYIIDEKHNHLPVNSGYEILEEKDDSLNQIINGLQNSVAHKSTTRHDLLTYASAKNYIEKKHPKILFLGLGETDEFAHKRQYDQYLQKAKQFDQILAELWYYVQTDPFYRGNTTFIITTDHGRGSSIDNWSQHGFWVKGSGEAWMAMIGRGINAEGELKTKGKLYQKQIASTVSLLANEKFFAKDHSVAPPISLLKTPPVLPAVVVSKQLTVTINK
jgi:hypothetical protein